MEASQKKLHFISYSNLNKWDAKLYLTNETIFNPKFKQVLFGNFLSKASIEKVKIEDEKKYKILGVRSYGKGVYLNRVSLGKDLKMKEYYKAKPNHLFWCKVDTKNGAFGVVNNELSDGFGSSNMTFAEIDTDKMNVDFLQLLFTSKKIHSYLDSFVTGTTNRKYIRPDQLLEEIHIPLPTLQEQQAIVESYFTKINKANQLEVEANNIDQEIEKYFLNQLGLKELNLKEKVKGLLTVDFKDLDRWDYFSSDYSVISQLKCSNYSLSKLGDIYSFAKRSFNKKTYFSATFKYIEIGAIDPTKGILEAKEIKTEKAPSRATQVVKKGDLILGLTRPYLKKFALVTQEYDDNICSSGFSVIEETKDYHLSYLLQFLKCSYGIEQLKNRMTGGLYPAITEGELKEIKIPLPDIDKQIEIMNSVNIKINEIVNNKIVIEKLKIQANEEFEKAIFQ